MNLFPFPVIREGQKEFMGDIEKALGEKKHLVAHADLGFSKRQLNFIIYKERKLIELIKNRLKDDQSRNIL